MSAQFSRVAFIGLGHMGQPMALNLRRAQIPLAVFDVIADACTPVVEAGGEAAGSIAEAVRGADAVVTMLPVGQHVREVYLGETGVLASLDKPTLLIDCSTIDVATARAVAEAARAKGHSMLDAPVSGGTAGAAAGTLTFMVGGAEEAFERAGPILERMGKRLVFTGAAGNGQAAKICNNMITGIAMLATSEAFCLGEKLGLETQALFDVVSTSSGGTWVLDHMCPVPGPVSTAPSSNGYRPGFKTSLMAKDLRLAQDAANAVRMATPLGALTASLFDIAMEHGHGEEDFSAIIKLLRPD